MTRQAFILWFSPRHMNFYGALLGVLLLGIGMYLEYTLGLLPCSLCILQRGLFLMLTVVFLIAVLHHPGRRGIQGYGLITLLLATAGALLAGRQIWLHLQVRAPAEVCLPGFSYMVAHLPLSEALRLMLLGSDNCGVVTWRLLGWSIPEWSLLWFVVLGLISLLQIVRGFKAAT